MHDNDLKQLWQEQSIAAPPVLPDDRQLSAMKRKTKSLDRLVWWRDFWELAASIVCGLVIGLGLLLNDHSVLTRIGFLILMFSCVFIGWRIMRSKVRLPKAGANAAVSEVVKAELAKVDAQIHLLKSSLPLHIIPIFIGLSLCGWELWSVWQKFVDILRAFIICGTFFWLNQFTIKNKLRPLKAELESLLNPSETVLETKSKKAYYMSKLMIIGIAASLFYAAGFIKAEDSKTPATKPAPSPVPTQNDEASISEMLETIRAKHKFPALAAAVVVDGKVIATNAVGVRVDGGTTKVTAEDKFHIGSVTKSMTATVAAMLVEAGKISWTTTIGESFPEFKNGIHPDYLGVTLEQLLANRGGVPGSPPNELWIKAWKATGTPSEQRLAFIQGILEHKPEAKPGKKNIYSNSGFTIAGVMLEKASGKTWEELMRTMLFEPLGMNSAGFGAPASLDQIDQPWGHTKKTFSELKPIPPGPRADNPLAISPAGAVHCSLGDMAKYAAFHMAGERGESKLLKAESFKKLHAPVGGDDYALGWIVLKRAWANGRALMHNGSNTMFYIVVWMAPEKNCAVIVAANLGSDEAFAGCDEAAGKLIQQYFAK